MFPISFGSKKNENGFIFLEVLISSSLIVIVFIVLLGLGNQAISISDSVKDIARVDFLLKEQTEAVRNFRDKTSWEVDGLGKLNTGEGNPYHMFLNTSKDPYVWEAKTGSITEGIFIKKIIFERVSRNPSAKNIEETYNAENDDPNTRKIIISVSWKGKTQELVTYLTNWQNINK